MHPAPAASDPVEKLADWLEFQVLGNADRHASLEEMVRVIRTSGSTDALESDEYDRQGDAGSRLSQEIAGNAFAELQTRELACGGQYPFTIEQGLLKLSAAPETSAYVLLLLLSAVQPTSGHKGTAVLFERLCTHAARQYLGGEALGVTAYRFGSPRRQPHARLVDAIDHLCKEMSEGGNCRTPDLARHKGDAGLDIVVWKHFPDRRVGKLIAFGQCAGGGTNWEVKASELDGAKFAKTWFREPLVLDPLRLFFVPRRIAGPYWESVGIAGGIVFDRCRVAALSTNLYADLAADCETVARTLLNKLPKP